MSMKDVIFEGLSEICLVNNISKSPKQIQLVADVWLKDLDDAGETDESLIRECFNYYRRNFSKWPLPADILAITDKIRSTAKVDSDYGAMLCPYCSDWFQKGLVCAMDANGRMMIGRCTCNVNPAHKDIPLLTDQIIQEKGWTRVKRAKRFRSGKDIYTPGYQHLVVKFWREGRSVEELEAAGQQLLDSYFYAKDNGERWFRDDDTDGMMAWLDQVFGKREHVKERLSYGLAANYD